MFRIAILFVSVFLFLTACQQAPQQENQQTTAATETPPVSQSQESPKEQMDKAQGFLATMDAYVKSEDFEGAKIEAEQAAYYLQKAVSIDPNYSAAVAPELARALYFNSNFQEAQTWYQEAVDADPNNPVFHKMLALSQFNLGNIPDGQSSVAKSMNFDQSEDNRQAIVTEMMRMGSTSFDFGTAYIEDGYPQKGADYQKYGLAMYRLAFDLGGHENQTMTKQIITWATYLEDQEVVDLYQSYLK